MIMTNYFIKKKINSLAGASPRRACYYRTFGDVRHILVFYDARDREPVALCMEKLRKLQKEVRGCVLVSSAPARTAETTGEEEAGSGSVSGSASGVTPGSGRQAVAGEASVSGRASGKVSVSAQAQASGRASADYFVSLSKSLNLWGFPSEATRRAVDALPADLLIDLTRGHCYAMQYLVWRHPSRFKVGPKREGLDLYDLSILPADRNDTTYLFDQILFYLQAIHS